MDVRRHIWRGKLPDMAIAHEQNMHGKAFLACLVVWLERYFTNGFLSVNVKKVLILSCVVLFSSKTIQVLLIYDRHLDRVDRLIVRCLDTHAQ